MRAHSCNGPVGRSMTEMLRLCLVTWCWLFVHGTMAARTRSLSLADVNSSDFNLTTPQLIEKYGYTVETHTIVSPDGYHLVLHRIPYGRRETETKLPKPAVLIHHALLCSSFDWVVMGPEKSLGFMLADAGYDVWLANARGNTYSRKHVSLDPSDSKFWDFSWHDMGKNDVPAEIDYILKHNGQQKLFYIGHSMGTTMFFVMTSLRPEYNEKIEAMIAFAPIGHFSRANNRKRLTVMLTHTPAGCSTRQVTHFAQAAVSGEFKQFDFGTSKNIDVYGQETPPMYDFSKVTTPVTLFYSDNDILAPMDNVVKLSKILGNVVGEYRVPFKSFNHIDFMWGKNADTLLYSKVLRILDSRGGNNETTQRQLSVPYTN
ncbi:Lipase 1 [Blattella germanica]|nr:Lipase 1 [Blattella germanica]